MTLHILNAQKKLTAHSEWLRISLTDTYERAKRTMWLSSLDVVVKAGNYVIPEKGNLEYVHKNVTHRLIQHAITFQTHYVRDEGLFCYFL